MDDAGRTDGDPLMLIWVAVVVALIVLVILMIGGRTG